MYQEYVPQTHVYVNRNSQGLVREILHLDEPWRAAAATPTLMASAYLSNFGNLLNISPAELSNMTLPPASDLTGDLNEYRLLSEKTSFDTTTLALQQTYYGLPVWEAGVSVHIKNQPSRVLSAQTTSHVGIQVAKPTQDAVKRALAISEQELAGQLGLNDIVASGIARGPKIETKRLVIYQYQADRRTSQSPQLPAPQVAQNQPHVNGFDNRGAEDYSTTSPTLPLPPPDPGTQDGQHSVSMAVYFSLPIGPYPELHWVAILEVQTLSVLYLRAFVDHVNGLVFQVDPVTTNGGPLPNAASATLNAVRSSVPLSNLGPPNGTQQLTGSIVQMSDVELPTIAPPTEAPAVDFNFDARSDNFGAVNTYFHCDSVFELLQSMGFNLGAFFGATTFPTPADHRGLGGNVINAHCLGTAGGVGIKQTAFALADTTDTTNPICIGCDYRVVLHELAGHGVLYPHVNSPNFGFSHSAGDGVAAILNDPQSVAADRFLTFPWIPAVPRRHDRDIASGWGWSGAIALNPFGAMDAGGYNNEQILSTTHFRMYRSMGGDASQVELREFAARLAVYLIMRAISTLTPATNPPNASAWATALITADHGDWTSEGLTGGAYSKVIRWAFEKQGLYQLPSTPTPNNQAGSPPAIDVYIDDGRGGEYQFQPVWYANQSMWNRRNADGGTVHEEPIFGVPNYAYVKIKNRGYQNATNVVVKAFHAEPGVGLSYPVDWFPMTTPQLSALDVPANNAAEITVGPFQWTPVELGHDCMFMIVTADGDSSNTDNIAAGDTIPEWRLVPHDNNVGQRNVYPVAGAGGTHGLVASFEGLKFRVKNPMATKAKISIEAKLPGFLARRNWAVEFLNAGQNAFPLAAGESIYVAMRLRPGAHFTTADVRQEANPVIRLEAYADGIQIGGMAYAIDPNRTESEDTDPCGQEPPQECVANANKLMQCVDFSQSKVKELRLRRVNVDLVLEDDCHC